MEVQKANPGQPEVGHGVGASVWRRLLLGFAATAFGPIVTTVVQVISLPVFLHYWGTQLYGEWLILSTVPTYLILSDFGFGSVAGNDMTMQVGRGDRDGALRTFQSAWALTSSLSLMVALLCSLLIAYLPLTQWLHLALFNRTLTIEVLLLLIASVLFSFQANMIGAGFRCDGNFAFGTMTANIVRLLEALAIIIAMLFHGGPLAAASAILAVRLVGNVLLRRELHRRSPWLRYGLNHASWQTIRELWTPAMAFMAFPAANSLNFQGTLLAIGTMLGPLPVVVFSTLRTLSRVPLQIVMVVQNGVWPEFSRAHGAGDAVLVRSLHRLACQVSVWVSLLFAIIIGLGGRPLLWLWSHGKVPYDRAVLITLLLGVIVNALWSASLGALLATNRHSRVAALYLSAITVALFGSCVLMKFFGLVGAAAALLTVDLLCGWVVLRTSLALSGDTLRAFATALLLFPAQVFSRYSARRTQTGAA